MSKRQFFCTLFCIIGLSTFLRAQSNVRLYGTCDRNELVKSIDIDSAGYQYIASDDGEDYRAVLTKLTPTHDVIWTKTIELDSAWQDLFVGSVLCFDSTVFVGGTYFHDDILTGDYGWRSFLAQYTNSGELVWFKNLDKHSELGGRVSLERLGNNLLYTSKIGTQLTPLNKEPNIICLNVDGNVLWSKRIEGAWRIEDLQALPDGSFIAMGHFPNLPGSIINFFLLKMSSTGNVQWQKSFSPTDPNDRIVTTSVSFISGSEIAVGGRITQTTNGIKQSGFYAKFDVNNGNIISSKIIEVADVLYEIEKVISKDGMHYLVGRSRIDNDFSFGLDLNLTKIDANGAIEWMYTYNDSMNANVTTNQLLVDAVYHQNRVLTVGTIGNYGAPYLSGGDIIHTEIRFNGVATHKKDTLYSVVYNYSLAPYDTLTFSNGFASDTLLAVHENSLDFNLDFTACELSTISLEEHIIEPKTLRVFPNPASEFLTIVCDEENMVFTLSDMTGRVLLQTKERTLDLRDLEQGYYLIGSEAGVILFYKVSGY